MAFNLNEFKSHIGKKGLAKSNLFFVVMSLPSGLVNSSGSAITERELRFYCRSASLPSPGISTTDVYHHGIGYTSKRATGYSNEPVNLTFMMDSGFSILKLFHAWQQKVVNFNNINTDRSVAGQAQYEVGWKDEYAAAHMSVRVFSTKNGTQTYEYNYYNVFPLTVGNVEVAWENDASVMTLPVSFSYEIFNTIALDMGSADFRAPSRSMDFQQPYSMLTSGADVTSVVDGLLSPNIEYISNIIA